MSQRPAKKKGGAAAEVIKNKVVPKMAPAGSASPSSSPTPFKKSPPPSIKKSQSVKELELLKKKKSSEETWGSHIADYAANLAALLVSIYLIYKSPLASNDVPINRPSGQSFLSLYLEGKLDKVDNISQMLVACAASVFMDIGVVSYHLLYPPHPKFRLQLSRRISIYTHLISGITEIITGILAFSVGSDYWQYIFARTMSLASITHVLTAYYQTSLVFGAKGIMVPGYIYAITLHANSAFSLYQNVNSVVFVLFTYLMLHIYVWCRFFIFFFRVCKMFTGYHYTVSITLSGLLLFPFVVGPIGNFGMMFVVIAYCGVRALLDRNPNINLAEKLFVEHERYALITSEQSHKWKTIVSSDDAEDADKKMAKEVFDRFDVDKSGVISANEIYPMLSALSLPKRTISKVLEVADVNGDQQISFNEFYRFIWGVGAVKDRLDVASRQKREDMVMPEGDEPRAQNIFDLLDIDSSGFITVAELDMLLTQWGMPHNEAQNYLNKHLPGSIKISFDDFFKHLRPIWEFAATQIHPN